MINSLYISVTGMLAFSEQIGVTSNNISNMETTGFKSSTVSFADMLAQSIDRSSGNNAGSGVQVQSVTENWTQGDITGGYSSTTLAINGWGMFAVKDPATGQTWYTRDGSFEFDNTGRLVYDEDLIVQGYPLDENGNSGALTNIQVSYENAPPSATTTLSTTVNLDSGAETGDTFQSTIDVYDSLGNAIPVTITYTKSATANEWTWTAEISSQYGSITSGASGTLTFDANGSLTSGADPVFGLTMTNGSADQSITWDLYDDGGDSNGLLTQYAGDSAMTDHDQDGYAAGELLSVKINEAGQVECTYSNGVTRTPFQIALAEFSNYNGLEKSDGNLYSATVKSGQAILGRPGVGSMGDICSESREVSNVDLSSEMAQLITAQTAYQACSRAFSVTNEILQVLVNMK
ncbi:MAG: flagellar hook protein FlgE [Thermodesulfobacteriota bacterium]